MRPYRFQKIGILWPNAPNLPGRIIFALCDLRDQKGVYMVKRYYIAMSDYPTSYFGPDSHIESARWEPKIKRSHKR